MVGTGPWLADNQSRDPNNEFWLVVYLMLQHKYLEVSVVEVDGGHKWVDRVYHTTDTHSRKGNVVTKQLLTW